MLTPRIVCNFGRRRLEANSMAVFGDSAAVSFFSPLGELDCKSTKEADLDVVSDGVETMDGPTGFDANETKPPDTGLDSF